MFVPCALAREDAAHLRGRDPAKRDSSLGCEFGDLAERLLDPRPPPGTRIVNILDDDHGGPVEPDEVVDLLESVSFLLLADIAKAPVDEVIRSLDDHEAEASRVEIDREHAKKPLLQGSGSSR